ncbi:hypothetical protein ACOMHN_042664 [Nucella lapillus]
MASATALSLGEQMAFVHLGLGLLLPLISSMVISLLVLILCRCLRAFKTLALRSATDRNTKSRSSRTSGDRREHAHHSRSSRWGGVSQRFRAVNALHNAQRKKKVAFD